MKTLLIFTAVFVITANAIAQWVQTATMNGPVLAIESSGTTESGGNEILYVGEGFDEGVWRSTDNGETWTQTDLDYRTVYALAASGTYVWAGTDEDGVYFSSNSGTTWNQTSLINRTVYSLEKNGAYLYAGTKNYGVYCSADNGMTWFQTSLNNRTVYSLSASANYLYAGTMNYGVYKSANYGTTWNQTPLNNLHIVCIAVNGNNVFAGTDTSGMWKSTNFGIDWTQSPIISFPIFVLRIMEFGLSVFAGTGNGVYVTHDNGASWNQRNEGFSVIPEIRALKITDNNVLSGVVEHRDVPYNKIYKRPLDELIGIQPISNHVPNRFSLSQNYPNPFNPTTHLGFRIANFGSVKLIIYDVLGTEIETLVDEQLNPGTYEVEWSATSGAADYPSGVYFYRLTTDGYSETKKMMLLK